MSLISQHNELSASSTTQSHFPHSLSSLFCLTLFLHSFSQLLHPLWSLPFLLSLRTIGLRTWWFFYPVDFLNFHQNDVSLHIHQPQNVTCHVKKDFRCYFVELLLSRCLAICFAECITSFVLVRFAVRTFTKLSAKFTVFRKFVVKRNWLWSTSFVRGVQCDRASPAWIIERWLLWDVPWSIIFRDQPLVLTLSLTNDEP